MNRYGFEVVDIPLTEQFVTIDGQRLHAPEAAVAYAPKVRYWIYDSKRASLLAESDPSLILWVTDKQ